MYELSCSAVLEEAELNYINNALFNFSVAARIRNLHDYQLRLLHNIMPVPSGVDVANTLKYFSQTLLSKYTYFILLFLYRKICLVDVL
jgi:hypothetical protein